MRYLITGGAGFIGSHLAEELLRAGHAVTVVDDLSTGSIENIEPLRSEARFQCVIDTVLNRRLMAALVDWADVIFHLAAVVGVKLVVEDPVRAIETNMRATEIILELSAPKRKKVVFTSTSEVYGKAARVPFREDDDLILGAPWRSRWGYACSKALGEFLALAYWQKHEVPVVIARLFNTVGPRQTDRYGMVIPTFVRQALRGEPITVYGDGQQTRSFCWVGDTVRALVALAEHPGAVGQIFNVGSDEEVRIIDVAHRVKSLTGSASPIIFVPYDRAYGDGFEDMRRRVPDLTKIRALMGYQPAVRLEEILRRVIAYYRQFEGTLKRDLAHAMSPSRV
ncbi:MAG: GDP-mannose 4,6-dehydratase [Blastocatellia bacterium]|nr:GDP-mannose 4,6-dehydratase [Blastocatellia bacterium]MCS7156504.1 GDP-mannose 4,6-dehydratase [Blastocatellia bacterium]MDW8168856.1 GDP-mannose 4,6-dehydratase [Acidobacteriota bacterium]MDW8256617.1 GDP-mannose 4,6-dehydratase [Acidobacteriota bacterium]